MTKCACGCGQETGPSKLTNRRRGVVKGQSNQYVVGHSPRSSPNYRRKSYIGSKGFGHRERAERALGKALPPLAEVHHPDEDPWNFHARLVICQDVAYHRLLHARMRIVKAGGNPNTDRICPRCNQAKPLTAFHPARRYWYCRECWLAYRRARQPQKKLALRAWRRRVKEKALAAENRVLDAHMAQVDIWEFGLLTAAVAEHVAELVNPPR